MVAVCSGLDAWGAAWLVALTADGAAVVPSVLLFTAVGGIAVGEVVAVENTAGGAAVAAAGRVNPKLRPEHDTHVYTQCGSRLLCTMLTFNTGTLAPA